MFTKPSKVVALILIAFLVFTVGCGNKAKNQVKQQSTKMQEIPNKMENRFDIAKAAADRITRITGVKQANVLVTRHNAYVAAVVNVPSNQMTKSLEDQIAKEVRITDSTIQNVYVSTNPEFFDRVNQYVEQVRQGRPVTGFFDELSQMIQRVFPVAR